MKENIYAEDKPMSGGQKRMWLRKHREEVLDFYEENGEEATRVKYQLVKHKGYSDTLASLLKGSRKPFGCEFTRTDGLEMRIRFAESEAQDLRCEVRELKEAYSKFQETVSEQLRVKFLMPLLQAVIKLDASFEPNAYVDRLNLDTLFKEPPKMIEGENIEQMLKRHQGEVEGLRTKKLKEDYLSAHPFAQPIVTEIMER